MTEFNLKHDDLQMTEFNLKHDDLVYYPVASNSPIRVDEFVTHTNGRAYPIIIPMQENGKRSFTRDGKMYTCDKNPTIFPATQEWYEKLVLVYPNLEAPPPPAPKKSSMDVIKAMLDDGYSRIPCYVSVINEKPNDEMCIDLLFDIDDSGSSSTPCRCVGGKWKYARPFDVKTGRVIVDYVDGQAVLED